MVDEIDQALTYVHAHTMGDYVKLETVENVLLDLRIAALNKELLCLTQ